MSMQHRIPGSVALVTGANRGIGATFVLELLAAGAQRVYASTRDPQRLTALALENPPFAQSVAG